MTTAAFSDASPAVAILHETEPFDIIFANDQKKSVILTSDIIPVKTTRSSAGVQVVNLKKNQKLVAAVRADRSKIANYDKLHKDKIPATPSVIDDKSYNSSFNLQ